MPFLSELLSNGPIDFEYVSHSPYQTFTKKAGGTYMAGELTLKTRSDGKISKEKIFNEAFYYGLTKRLTPGCLVRASQSSQNPKNVDWLVLPSGEESLALPQQNNTQQVKNERAYTESNDEQAIKSITIHLNGLFQAYVSNPQLCSREDTSHDEIIDDALSFAESARRAINARAKALHMGISLPVQTTKIEEVEAAFGDDEQAPFPTE